MDCYYHHAVPSVARCTGCRQPICATCRDHAGTCSGCRLGARIEALRGAPEPREGSRPSAVAVIRPESRALVALGYPFWPLAVVALLDSGGSAYSRRQALQALAFNFGMMGLGFGLYWVAAIPFFGWSAIPIAPLVLPITFVAGCIYGFKAWHGDEIRIPVVTDFIERRSPTPH